MIESKGYKCELGKFTMWVNANLIDYLGVIFSYSSL
jgi:hypothetical protein